MCLCLLQVLAKIGERLGDVQVQVPPAGAAAAAAVRPPAADVPDIDNLIDAAKYGDLEAVEDFIAIGKVCASPVAFVPQLHLLPVHTCRQGQWQA
jgi:hypothetical protein